MGKDLFEELFVDGIHLVTKIKKNMKNTLMHLYDKILLRKRAVVERQRYSKKPVPNRAYQEQKLWKLYHQHDIRTNCICLLSHKTQHQY
ncbi:transposase [Arenibacter sp. M-2]|uniref:transposase n=1 Tax=Arenibacter sp. M-2 TaxID=3053612 RepID=UPI003364EB8C